MSDSSDDLSDLKVLVKVKQQGGEDFELEVNVEESVSDLKELLLEVTDIPVDAQRLVIAGKVLREGEPLKSYGTCSIVLSLCFS